MDGKGSGFPDTQWTAVVKAACSGDTQGRHHALGGLCKEYWMPLYAFSRRLGYNSHDAQDLTQGFFAYLLQNEVLHSADRELGTLRTFLLKVFQRYIGDVRDRETAQKRGGQIEFSSLDLHQGEDLLGAKATMAETPESLYDRAWAHSVLRSTLVHLGGLEAMAGRGRAFALLESCLNPDAAGEADYAAAAAELGINQDTVRQMVSRLRKRFRDCLRSRIAATLHEPDETRIDEELLALRSVLRRQA